MNIEKYQIIEDKLYVPADDVLEYMTKLPRYVSDPVREMARIFIQIKAIKEYELEGKHQY